jgi:23S rRNA (pseudouridine1915-N3)-methyltransferase
MKCRLVAAGTRLPDWVEQGFREYQRRLRAPLELELIEIPLGQRRAGEDPQPARAREGARMLDALDAKQHVVALEVEGRAMSTAGLAQWLGERLRAARPLALLIGGPDGLDAGCRARADETWSLSPLTLPHALVRVLVAEQLYRAMSLMSGHPYHRA